MNDDFFGHGHHDLGTNRWLNSKLEPLMRHHLPVRKNMSDVRRALLWTALFVFLLIAVTILELALRG